MINQIACSKIQDLDVKIQPNSVSLSIVALPTRHDFKKNIKESFRTLLNEISKITKIGGVCCFITSSDKYGNSESMDLSQMTTLLDLQNESEIKEEWIFYDKILWSKSPKDSIISLNPLEEITMVDFEQTPFSTIDILIKNKNNGIFDENTIPQRIQKLKITQAKKDEMLDSFWYIIPESDRGYQDHLPKELIARLVLLCSNQNDIVLDPFAGHCVTALVCKSLRRNFICLIQNQAELETVKERISKEEFENDCK